MEVKWVTSEVGNISKNSDLCCLTPEEVKLCRNRGQGYISPAAAKAPALKELEIMLGKRTFPL